MICRLSGIEGFGFVRIKFFSSPLHKVKLYSYPSLLAFKWQSPYSPPLHSVSDDWSFLRPPWKPWISPKKSSNRPPPFHLSTFTHPSPQERSHDWFLIWSLLPFTHQMKATNKRQQLNLDVYNFSFCLTLICYFILKLFWLAVEGKLVLTFIS